jgi:hypothetical protein
MKAVTISRRHFWKLHELTWCRYLFNLAGYPANSVSGIRPDIRQIKSDIRPDTGYKKKGQIIRPHIRPAGYPVHP